MRAAIAFLFVALVALVAFAAPSASADVPALRWSRPVQLASEGEGWARVALPDDVLAACRPGLPDLRVRNAAGAEVPYVLEHSLGGGVPEEWIARDVESGPGQTTATIDRGPHPRLSDEATIELDAAEFLKPIVLEASDDAHAWKEIARGSIFATRDVRMTTLRFAPNDRRYWRLRLDDRNGAPVAPRAVLGGAFVESAPAPREIALDVKRRSSEGGESTYEVTLPSANLTVSSLAFEPTDGAFERRVTVLERVLFRDEITRRTVGSATISRGPGGASLSVPLGGLRGPLLEIRIEDGASPPLALAHATATIAPRSVLFYVPAPAAASLPWTLEYGSPVLGAARYDLAAVLAKGRPDVVRPASLGAAVDRGAASPVGVPPHGGAIDESRWQTKAAIDLPGGGGGVAYLPLEGIDSWGGLRIVDAASREVPFLFEQTVHHARETVHPAVAESAERTTLTLSSLAALRELDAIELTATAPDYFRREVTVVEAVRDARGPVGERRLGGATWERKPGEAASPLRIALSTPAQSTIEVRLENGSNPPLTLGSVTLERSVRRVDFIYAKGESLSLLTGNAGAGAPSYDLALLAGALLALPAEPAHLEPARDIAPGQAPPAKWFWVAVIVAGLGVAAALGRALRGAAKGT